jgi:aspartyl/asparaginyl beta-hydroxylase (cupin superfamily)
VPAGKSWIKVGGEKREWQNGKAMVFDTHYTHETGECSLGG